MDIHRKNVLVQSTTGEILVNLKWYRGANRYNNGATRYGNKYKMRYSIGRIKELSLRSIPGPANIG